MDKWQCLHRPKKEALGITSVWRNGGCSASYDSFVVGSSAVLRMNICAKNPPLRQAENRYAAIFKTQSTMKKHSMKTILISLFIISISAVYGQTTADLDVKKGFKEFKIGDHFSKWQDSMKFERSWDDGTRAYLYTGPCCRMVFDYPVERIALWLRNDTVVGIHVTLEKFQKEYSKSGKRTDWRADDFEKINGLFTALFGKASDMSSDKATASVTNMWIGKKVSLISTYEYLGLENGDQQTIVVMSNVLGHDYIKDGF